MGGLTVLDAIAAALPEAPFVYVADNAGFPYGEKTTLEIGMRVPALLGRLVERYRPQIVVIACNTASTIALTPVRKALDLPVVGTVPAIKPAAEITRTGVIGVLGTAATVRQPYVDRLAEEFAQGITVIRHGAPKLVRAAEAKLRGGMADRGAVREALALMAAEPGGDRMDVVVLACTHFPLLLPELEAEAPPGIRFVDGAEGIARRVVHLLDGVVLFEARGRAVFTADNPSVRQLEGELRRRGLTEIDFL